MDEEAEERWRALDVEGANQGETVEASRHLPRGPLMEIRSLDLILFHRAQNYDPTLLWGTRARASARWRRARVAYIRVGLSRTSLTSPLSFFSYPRFAFATVAVTVCRR